MLAAAQPFAGNDRRRRPRVSLTDVVDDPADLETQLMERVRAAPPEAVEDEGPRGALQYALEILDLPRNAIANLINYGTGLNAEPTSKRTFAGLRKIAGSDLLKAAGLNPSGATGPGTTGNVADFLGGFLADVALDPLTWITGPAGFIGSSAKKVGGTALKRAGVAALDKTLAERIAAATVKGGAEAGQALKQGYSVLGESHPVRKILELPEAEQAANAAAVGLKLRPEVVRRGAPAATDIGRAYDAEQGAKRVRELMAERLAKESPELVDRTAIGLSTEGMRNFHPLDLPALITQGLGGLIGGRRVGSAIGKGYEGLRKITRPVLNPLSFLPEAETTLLTKDAAGALAERLGLPWLAGKAMDIPGVRAGAQFVSEGGKAIGHTLRRMFSTTPPPARSNELGELERVDAEHLEKFARGAMERSARTQAFDETRGMQQMFAEAADATGVPQEIVKAAAYPLAEAIKSVRAGKMYRSDLVREIEATVKEAGGTPEQAQSLVSFLPQTAQGRVPPAWETPRDALAKLIEDPASRTSQVLRRQLYPELVRSGAEIPVGAIDPADLAARHKAVVKAAMETGRKPPAEVLADYPELTTLGTPKLDALAAAAKRTDQELAAYRKRMGYGKKTSRETLAADVELNRLQKAQAEASRELARNQTLHQTALDRERAATAAAQGDADSEMLHRVPLELMPRPVQMAVREEAQRLLNLTDSERTQRALQRIIRGGKDVGGEPERQKKRIFELLLGETDARSAMEIEAGLPERPPDPVVELYAKSKPSERAAIVDEALAGGPDHPLAQMARLRLSPNNPEAADPEYVRSYLEQLRPSQAQLDSEKLAAAAAADAAAEAARKAATPDTAGGLAEMVDRVLPDLRPEDGVERLRTVLVERFGGKAVDAAMAKGLRTNEGLRELDWNLNAARKRADAIDDPLTAARAQLSGLGHDELADLPEIDWRAMQRPLTADNVDTALAANPGLREWITGRLTPRRATELTPSELAEKVNALGVLHDRATAAAATPLGLGAADNLPGQSGALQIHPAMQQIVDHVQEAERNMLMRYDAAGAKQPRLSTERLLGYVKRLLGDPGTKAGELMRRAGLTLKSAAMQMRTAWREKLVTEINREVEAMNEYLRTGTPRDAKTVELASQLGLKEGEQLPQYSADLLTSHVARQVEAERVIGSAEFFQELVRRFGVRVHRGDNVPDGYVKANAQKFGDIIREYAFRPAVARVIEQHVKLLEEPNKVLSAYRNVLGVWKGLALLAPGYHLNNLFGNVWNAKSLEAWTPEAFDTARRIQLAFAGKGNLARRVAGVTKEQLGQTGRGAATFGDIYKAAFVDGLLGSGLFHERFTASVPQATELIEALTDPARAQRVLANWKNPLKMNMALGQISEEAGRLTAFVARLQKGDSAAEAAQKVRAALFDYGDTTAFERGLPNSPGIRDAIPFWTWTRFNSRLLLRMALSDPKRLALIPKVQLNLEQVLAGADTLPDSLRPEHITSEGGVQVSGGANPQFWNIGRTLPIGELPLINPLAPVSAANKLLESAAGPAKTAYELVTNKDTFFNRPIREYPGQTKEFLGMAMPPEAKHVLRTVRPLNMLEQLGRQVDTGDAAASFGMATGVRLFPIDVRRQAFEAENRVNQEISAVRRDLRRRIGEVRSAGGDPLADAEAGRLLGIHEELRARRAELPGQAARAMTRTTTRERQQRLNELIDQYQQQAATANAE